MIQKFEFQELDLKGAWLIKPFYATDHRGGLIKDYNVDVFREHGICHDLKEVFYTVSKKGVIRATHFQLEKQQAKLVRCICLIFLPHLMSRKQAPQTAGNMMWYVSRNSMNDSNSREAFPCPQGLRMGTKVLLSPHTE